MNEVSNWYRINQFYNLCLVVNDLWQLKDGNFEFVENDIRKVKEACGSNILNVIIEACLLSDEEKITAFEQTFATLKLRVETMLTLPLETLTKDTLTAELNKIGQLTA